MNEETRKTFVVRSKVVQPFAHSSPNALSGSGNADDAPHPGGASARLSSLTINALDMGYLPAHRAGTLPQALGGGRFRESVRNNRNFRNEGLSTRHNPEIHHDRVLRGVPGLQLPHGFDRGNVPRS